MVNHLAGTSCCSASNGKPTRFCASGMRIQVPIRNFLLFLLLCMTANPTRANPRPLWGTLRPHALISTRASVPHSPYFGFAYHPAKSLDIRHLATDHADEITFSYSRHDGRLFGDQEIRDTGLNLLLRTHFHHHPTAAHAWALRVTAEPLNPALPTSPASFVFYAAAGPDDAAPGTASAAASPTEWGTLNLEGRVSKEGISDDVALSGNAASVGGAFRVVVKEPPFGSVSPSALHAPPLEDVLHGVPRGSGSRGCIRARAQKPATYELPTDAFHVASSLVDATEVWAVEKELARLLRIRDDASGGEAASAPSVYLLNDAVKPGAAGIFVQRVMEAPFQIEAVFVQTQRRTPALVQEIEEELSGENLDVLLERSRDAFDRRFDSVFRLREKGLRKDEEAFAKAALSNVMGGIGYFYGSSVARSGGRVPAGSNANLQFLAPVGLLTATPSRSSFPRGFLWDEGFHQLIVQRWDPELSRECMRSWMDVIQETGWIPREQILGLEARSRIPQHVQSFMIQDPLVANPPTILMPLRVHASISLSDRESNVTKVEVCKSSSGGEGECASVGGSHTEFTNAVLERVVQYYSWLKRTQSGNEHNSFRWRGRSPDFKSSAGYPLTLASGLDDYPRAENPSTEERHVDLHCWMTWASSTLAKLAEKAGQNAADLWEEHHELRRSLIDFHGTGTGTDANREELLLCDYDGEQRLCHEGYLTILPLILGLLDPSDIRVGAILDSLEDPSLLRAQAGVRSLSKSDRWYRTGDDYWTGPIWMPFNFLTLTALKTKYSVEDGPFKARAGRVFTDLRKSVLENAYKVFSETGQLWENYSPEDDGAGKRGRQFTGWSALILLIYADMFDGVI